MGFANPIERYTDPHFQRKKVLTNIRGIAEIIVPVRGYGKHSPKLVIIKKEWLTDEVLLSFHK